jgi:hypothetical protein
MLSSQPQDMATHGLDRYRTYKRFYERYWSRLFSMTQADMVHFVEQMRARETALDLTTLAREVIRTRLHNGPQLNSGPAPDGTMHMQAVRLWDPGAMWRVGDRAIMTVPKTEAQRFYIPAIGEIRQVGDDHVVVQIDGLPAPQVYALGVAGAIGHLPASQQGIAGQALLTDDILALADREDEASQIDLVLWRFGSSVVGRLLHALQADPGFMELEGAWYYVDLARPLREAQVVALSRAMFAGSDRPLTVSEALALLSVPATAGVAEQFGVLLSLRERPDLFTNVGSPSHPRWILAGPPPVRLVARHAVYDPETYVVLCSSGDALSPQSAQRLWDVGLLRAALGADEPDSVPEQRTGDRPGRVLPLPEGPTAHARTPQRRSWRRWLSFGSRD